ncbi:hypothetical protein Mterra_02258 [Calidithermus terrae]|uniref:Uncharacterized protein n=1 Tax=Calidithermus terrae TaxID=1408545 RepID=A0A399EN17_9DEIN|nr:hypothetical protein [Calidithermus terrae]RIH83541.1 hypothetical protein Mterra_02258 [Calidithermus terrae]
MEQPYRLDQGIYIESADVLLPWLCANATARMHLGLENYRTDKRTLVWETYPILGGIPVALHCKFVRLEHEPDTEPRRLRYAQFFPNLQQLGVNAQQAFGLIKQHLSQQLGTPPISSNGGVLYPFAEWEWDKFAVTLKLTGREPNQVCVGELWKKPIPRGVLEYTRMDSPE